MTMNTKAEEKFNNETIITCTCKGKGGRLTNGWDWHLAEYF
jgi:hypothetical protein